MNRYYADQRFYASAYGRFNTPDPYSGSAKPRNPGSWNRYSYTLGDPINGSDPSGLDGIVQYTYAGGTGSNACQTGQNSVGLISVDSCLDTTDIENSVLASVAGLSDTVYDWGATFYANGTATAPTGTDAPPQTGDPANDWSLQTYNAGQTLSTIPDDPDYNQLCTTVGLAVQFGVCVAKNLQDGSVYFGPTVSLGLSWPPSITVSAVTGRLNQTLPPSAGAVNSWLGGASGSVTGGAGVIGSVQISNGQNGLENSVERGFGNPQVGVSVGYNFCITPRGCKN